MTKWDKLLQSLNQTFETPSGVISSVKPVHQAFDADTKEQAIVLQYRFMSGIDNSTELQKLLVDRSALESKRPKRLLDVVIDALLASGKWPR